MQLKNKVDIKKSLTGKIWNTDHIRCDIGVFEQLCIQRGLDTDDIKKQFFIDPASAKLHDALLLKDIQPALNRIKQAIENKERILLYGDYDVDGISGTAIVFKTLIKAGAQVSYRLPHREKDGYGLNISAIEECASVQASLLITIDCGSSNAKEISYAKEQGIDSIIIDHHSIPKDLPTEAIAFINPHRTDCDYPFNDLSGSAVAYKVSCALLDALHIKDASLREELLHLASLGVVADCVPLLGENRNILKKSFSTMSQTKNNGLRALFTHNSVDTENIDSFTIGFIIGPRINAPGRLASPYYSMDLLLGKTAKLLTVEEINNKRKELVQDFLIEAENTKNNYKEDNCIVVSNDKWHVGVVGLLAGKLTEKYNIPSVALQKKGDQYTASARAPEYFNLVEALHSMSELFIKYGGHHQAAGFSLHEENLENFKKRFQQYCAQNIQKEDTIPKLHIDAQLSENDLGLDMIETLQSFGPFGVKNVSPRFILPSVRLEDCRAIGSNKKHLKTQVVMGNTRIDSIGFQLAPFIDDIEEAQQVDVVGSLERNEWNGRVKAQFRIEDIRI